MRLYRRVPDGPWWADFWHNGRRVRRSSGTTRKADAQRWAEESKAGLWRTTRLGERPVVTWDEAVLEWLDAHQHLRALSDRKDQLRWASGHLRGVNIATIDRTRLVELGKLCAKEPKADGSRRSDTTVNRYLAAISAVLGHAVKAGHLNTRPSVPKRHEANGEFLWATEKQAAKLLAALPAHLAAMARFSLATGLRQRNVTHLEWARVSLPRRVAWIESKSAKGKRAITVPLNDDAMAVLTAQKGKHEQWVFPYGGRPIETPARTAWKGAVRKAKLPAGFRWHDLRHTWASWHVQRGTPLAVLQQLGGWATLAMVTKYGHFAPGHLAGYVENSSLGGTEPGTRRALSA